MRIVLSAINTRYLFFHARSKISKVSKADLNHRRMLIFPCHPGLLFKLLFRCSFHCSGNAAGFSNQLIG
jgi:hypothetical protein